jgi:hypothetical protein
MDLPEVSSLSNNAVALVINEILKHNYKVWRPLYVVYMNILNIPKIVNPSPHWEHFKILYRDFEKSFEYIHPTESHFKVYSIRHYEYLLRASTEFESVCKGELFKAGLAKEGDWLNIKDYAKLETFYRRKLSSYEVGFRFNEMFFVRPLGSWTTESPLSWYQNYNTVKHHRLEQFSHASFENVLNAMAGLFVVLLAAGLCPRGNLAFGENQLLRWHEEWPVVIKKDVGEQVYNR